MAKCPICFKKANYTTACNHTFCKKCLYLWKKTCPLCRKRIQLEYPNTRAMATREGVCRNTTILLMNIKRTKKKENKLKFAEKLLYYIWDNRIVMRKYGRLCDVIHGKSLMLKREYEALGIVPPKVLKKTMTI